METCYLCGATENLTDDHIPPRGFFPDPKPDNLITVRCCHKCNDGFSLDDQYFRALFSHGATASDAGKWIRNKKVLPKIHTIKQAGLLNKFRESLTFVDRNGTKLPALRYPRDRSDRFMVRIAKGLLRHFYPDYNYSKDEFYLTKIEPEKHRHIVADFRNRCRYDARGDQVFEFLYGITEGKEGGVWIMQFYRTETFIVMHSSDWKIPTKA